MTIYTSAIVFRNPAGHVLTARKTGTSRFMLVGGKPEPGENPLETGLREIEEEIGVRLGPEDLRFLGMWETDAANEAGETVHGTAYVSAVPLESTPRPATEIAEVRWLDPDAPFEGPFAPLLTTRILPALAGQPHPWDPGCTPETHVSPEMIDRLIALGENRPATALRPWKPDQPLPRRGDLSLARTPNGALAGIIEVTGVEDGEASDIVVATMTFHPAPRG